MYIPVVKERYLLLEQTGETGVYNVVPYNSSTYLAYQIDVRVLDSLINSIELDYSITKEFLLSYLIKNLKVKNFLVVKTNDYLPCFFTSDGYLCFNYTKFITFLSNKKDLYGVFLYGFVLRDLINHNRRLINTELYISALFYALLVKFFRKSQGLIGYDIILLKLRFLTSLYVYVSLYDYKMEEAIKRLTSFLGVDISGLKLNYDFNDPRQFFKCLYDNSIMSVSSLNFVNTFVNNLDEYSIVNLEDAYRTFATIYVLNSFGVKSLFSSKWLYYNNEVTVKISDLVDKIVKLSR